MCLRVSGLPERISVLQCNLATTYFMEMWKGKGNKQVKFYESDLWVNEFDRDF